MLHVVLDQEGNNHGDVEEDTNLRWYLGHVQMFSPHVNLPPQPRGFA